MENVLAQFEVRTKIAPMCDYESSRYALSAAQLTPDPDPTKRRAFLCATDGRAMAMAIVSVDGESDREYLVPSKILPTVIKGGRIQLNGRWENDRGAFLPNDVVGRFPKGQDIVPAIAPDAIALQINCQFLLNLQEALNERGNGAERVGLTLFIPQPDEKSKRVESVIAVVGAHGIGAVMPMTRGTIANEIREYEDIRSQFTEARRAIELPPVTEKRAA